jgi:hypothetical protein
MVRVAQTGPGPLTPARAFGTLYARLNLKDSTKDPGPIKALVREVAFETMALGEGEVVLGELLKQRRFHTAASLARTHGLDTRTLRHLLVADGVISADRRASDDLPFDATTGDALAVRAKTAVPISALPYHLGCTRPQAQQIVAAGLLRPLVEDPAASHGILRCAVPRSDVEALLDALHARAPEIPSVPDETVSIAKAAEKTRRSSAEILRLLLEGDFPGAVRPKGTRGIKAIRISVDVLPVQIPAERPGIGVTAFFKDLGLSHAEGARLIALSTTVPLLRPVSDGGRTSRRARLRADDVQVFKTTYVTLSQLCRATGRHHQTVARSLFRAEVKPALDPKLLGFDLYRRADIPPKLFR